MSDLGPLLSQALECQPGGLVHELMLRQARIKAQEGRQMVMADLPESAQKFFSVIYSVRRTPGRPSKANAEILAVRRAYERAVARWIFNQKKALLAFGKRTGMMEVIGNKSYPLPALKPSDSALCEMAETSGLSEGALLDLVYPDRRKRIK